MSGERQDRRWDSDPTAPRVLIECRPNGSPEMIADALAREGFAVSTCRGPGDGVPCDLVEHGACALVDEADVVVNLMDDTEGEGIARAVTEVRRPPAVVVEANAAHPAADAASAGADVVRSPLTRDRLVGAIRRALERSRREGPPWSTGV